MWEELDKAARAQSAIPVGYDLRAVNLVGTDAILTYRCRTDYGMYSTDDERFVSVTLEAV